MAKTFLQRCNAFQNDPDAYTAVLDDALTQAESRLQKFLPAFTPEEIHDAFVQHVQVHLREELEGGLKHGNSVSKYRAAVRRGAESV